MIFSLVSVSYCKIRLYSPADKRSLFKSKETEGAGHIDYTIGMMGNIDYREKYLAELRLYPNEDGCEYANASSSDAQSNRRLVYLVKRGGCTFSKKVSNISLSGGDLAIIYDNVPLDDISNIVPVLDKKS